MWRETARKDPVMPEIAMLLLSLLALAAAAPVLTARYAAYGARKDPARGRQQHRQFG
jgi:hypothetical protein